MTETSAPLCAVGSLTTGQPVAAGVIQLATATVLNIVLEILSKKKKSMQPPVFIMQLCVVVVLRKEEVKQHLNNTLLRPL